MKLLAELTKSRHLKWGDPDKPDDEDAVVYLCALAADEITRLREELEKSVAYELASRTLTDVANRRADAAEARVEEITRLREELEALKGINLKREDAYSELLIRADALDAAKGE